MESGVPELPALARTMQGEEMLQPEEGTAMMQLHGLGWGAKRLSSEFGCARSTVRRYLRAAALSRSMSLSGDRHSMGKETGCVNAFSGTMAMPM